MAAKKKRPRAKRRSDERNLGKLTRDIERLAFLSPGGAPDRAVEITAPSEVEVFVRAAPCPRCRATLRLEDHTAETIDGRRLRVAYVACAPCGAKRRIYFRLTSTSLN
jgi:hypothetical protein